MRLLARSHPFTRRLSLPPSIFPSGTCSLPSSHPRYYINWKGRSDCILAVYIIQHRGRSARMQFLHNSLVCLIPRALQPARKRGGKKRDESRGRGESIIRFLVCPRHEHALHLPRPPRPRALYPLIPGKSNQPPLYLSPFPLYSTLRSVRSSSTLERTVCIFSTRFIIRLRTHPQKSLYEKASRRNYEIL